MILVSRSAKDTKRALFDQCSSAAENKTKNTYLVQTAVKCVFLSTSILPNVSMCVLKEKTKMLVLRYSPHVHCKTVERKMHFIQWRKKRGQELFLRELLLEAKDEEAFFTATEKEKVMFWHSGHMLCRIVAL